MTQPAAMAAKTAANLTTDRRTASFSGSAARRIVLGVATTAWFADTSGWMTRQVRFRKDRTRWNPDECQPGRFDRLRLTHIGILTVRLCVRQIIKFDDSDDAEITTAQHEVGDELLKCPQIACRFGVPKLTSMI